MSTCSNPRNIPAHVILGIYHRQAYKSTAVCELDDSGCKLQNCFRRTLSQQNVFGHPISFTPPSSHKIPMTIQWPTRFSNLENPIAVNHHILGPSWHSIQCAQPSRQPRYCFLSDYLPSLTDSRTRRQKQIKNKTKKKTNTFSKRKIENSMRKNMCTLSLTTELLISRLNRQKPLFLFLLWT